MRLEDAKFCAVDIETTGLNFRKDEIISIACIPIFNLRILIRDSFYTLIKPRTYRIESMKYHGISMDNLEAAPKFEEIATRIFQSIDGILVGYSVEFDYIFLKRYFKSSGVKLRRDWLDIVMIERWLRQRRGVEELDLSFEAIMARYGLKEYYRHHAFADAYFAAQVFQMQVHELLARGVDCVEKLIKLVKSCRYSDHGFAYL